MNPFIFSLHHLRFSAAALRPRLEDAQRRLQDAKTKQVQLTEDLEALQSNLNATKSTTV